MSFPLDSTTFSKRCSCSFSLVKAGKENYDVEYLVSSFPVRSSCNLSSALENSPLINIPHIPLSAECMWSLYLCGAIRMEASMWSKQAGWSYQGFSHTEREGWVCLGIRVVKGTGLCTLCTGLCTLCTQSFILLKAGAKGDWLRVSVLCLHCANGCADSRAARRLGEAGGTGWDC